MPNKRAEGKSFVGGYILTSLRDRLKAFIKAGPGITETGVITEALTDYLDKHAPETSTEEQ